jgi:aminopeptidase N
MTKLLPSSSAVFALILGLVSGPGRMAVAAPGDPPSVPPIRADVPTQLPRGIVPTHYEVSVTPHAADLQFDGHVAISIEVLEPTSRITLNALELELRDVRLTGAPSAAPVASPKIAVDPAAQAATFTFAQPLPRGAYRLAIDYSGRIGTQAVGLFALDYDTPAGRKRALFTQFENSDARRFIPCWDEPAYRATFDLEAIVPSGEMAVSNMPVAQRTDLRNGTARVRFATSPRMSTYLLFFAVGDLDRATTRVGETEIGVVTKKGALDQAQFALDSSAIVLREYNDYFGTPYPLPKLDNIAAPGRSQFFGAMENWGAIFTFEYALLVDPSISTEGDRQSIFEIAAHEISHQWFGDLVTMAWWDDLWLNEGFASWMAGRTTEKLHPEWNSSLGAVTSRDQALERDALATTHPVVQRVETVEQASQAFDDITYNKGEAVIRMLEGYVGADAWRAGVRRYIRRHAYANTVSDDLWRDIEAEVGKPITSIAHDFTLQPGVPLITVSDATCRDGASQVTLTQSELSKDQPEKKPLAWRVPVIVKSLGASTDTRSVIEGGKASVVVPGCDAVVVNAGQSGYYRTLYAPAQFERLAARFAAVAPIDQLGLLLDSWSLGRAGRQSGADVLELATATPPDADPQIWGEIASIFADIDDYYRDDPSRRAAFRKFAIARLAPVFARTGWNPVPDEPATVAILRTRLMATLSVLGDGGVIDEARRRYLASASDPSAVPGSLRKVILGVVARHADAAAWDELHAAALAEKTPLVKENLYLLLAATEDAALARRALDLALTAEPGATISAGMIARVAEEHPDLAYDFALAHMAAVNDKVDASSRSRYYAGLGGQSSDPAMVGKLTAYATAHLPASARRDTETAIAKVKDRIRVRGQVLPAIDAWLARSRGGSRPHA